jgi:thymidylate kinase
MDVYRKDNRINFVSFSGIDGAGKGTQIMALCAWLRKGGRRVLVIRFWDDIARFTRTREESGHRLFKGDRGIGTPALPISRRDKNVKSFLMTWVRLLLYFVDALSLRVAVQKALRSDFDLVIFDRYIYDELANLPIRNPAIRAYVRAINGLVPKPHISYILDADPVKARERKPEYPLEFLYTNRQSFLDLGDLIGGMTVIAPMPVQEVKRAVFRHAFERLSFRALETKNEKCPALKADDGQWSGLDGPESRPASS